MIINSATRRPKDPRESRAENPLAGTSGVRAVGSSPNVSVRNGQLPLSIGSSRGNDSTYIEHGQHRVINAHSSGVGAGWNLLAPLTVGFIMESITRAAERKAIANLTEIAHQLEQYNIQTRNKLKQQKSAPPAEPENPDIEVEAETKSDTDTSKQRPDLNDLLLLRGTGKKISLPQRLYVPGPVRAGRVFQQPDFTEELHKMFKSSWVKLRSHRK
ncbi:MAG: hypothetical protein K8F25_07215 [Fimbriimonadaceae bacterium]|nr:hypothetical protein [Alphaproteobacteria bacterium]